MGSRELPKIGLRFSILIQGRFNADIFTGICMGAGCPRPLAEMIAADLLRLKVRETTARPLDFEKLRDACRDIGIMVREIPPR